MSFDFIVGEDSVGAWISGVLLIVSSTITTIIGVKRGWYPWLLFSVFFMLLAIDENFMIHEALKRSIVFVRYEQTKQPIYWIGEIPVMLAALLGGVVAWVMWRHVSRRVRWLIVVGVLFGTASVIIDVLSLGILWEDSFKLIGEFAVTCSLVSEVKNNLIKN